jgi:phage terminase small subunit
MNHDFGSGETMTLPPKPEPPTDPDLPEAPKHLRPATQAWFVQVHAEFDLEPHQTRVLILAAEAWDRAIAAREAIGKLGLTYKDRFGAPHARPEIAIERDSRTGFLRAMGELNLEISPPPEPRQGGRQPGVPLLSNYRNRRR